MSNTIDRDEFRTQLEAVTHVQPKPTFFRGNFFPTANDKYSPTDKAEWDEVTAGTTRARYVNPRIPATPTDRTGFVTKEITTPFIQESRIITADMLRNRRAGENIYSNVTPAERALQYRSEDYQLCIDSIDARIEEQCASMIMNGRVDIVNLSQGINDYVDYGFNNKLTLASGDLWSDTGVNPNNALDQIMDELTKRGFLPDRVLMGKAAFRAYINNPEVQKMHDLLRLNGGTINPSSPAIASERYMGRNTIVGLDIYTYNAVYVDPITGAVSSYIPDNAILVYGAEARDNRIIFGAVTIIDPAGEWLTVEGRYVPQTIKEEVPSSEQVWMTSRPLPAPKHIDSWYVATVL